MIPESLKLEISAEAMHEGWASIEKMEAMAELIIETRPALCVELGVFGGRSLVAQAQALKYGAWSHSKIWGIDPWTVGAALQGNEGDANGEWWRHLDMDKIRNDCLNGISRRGLWPWVKIIVAESFDCRGLFENIDILHIDGNHSEEAAVQDVQLWRDSVRPGGFIWFDDTDWASTQAAIGWLDSSCNRVKDVGTCRLYQTK